MQITLISGFSLVTIFIVVASKYILSYCLGYYEEEISLVQYRDCLIIIEWLIMPIPIIAWVISLVRKKHRLWTTMLMGVLLVIIVLEQIITLPSPDGLIAVGLRDRLLHDKEIENLRRFAVEFNELPRLEGDHVGAETNTKSYDREELSKSSLKGEYPFLQWVKGPGFSGPSYVHEEAGIIDVRWGGALIGHWGFSVAIDHRNLELPNGPDIKSLRLSDDIVVVFEPD